jgi:hypothetical protein
MRELAPKSAASMDIDPRAVTNKTPEPLKIEGPGADFWNRVAFAVGLLLGVGAAISLLLGLL